MGILTIGKKNDVDISKNKKDKKNKQALKNVDRVVVQELLDIKSINNSYIKKGENKNFCYLKIKPLNVNIMPDKIISIVIEKLSITIDMIKNFSIMVVDKVETLEDNKEYMRSLLKSEENQLIRELIQKDIEMLNSFEEGEGSSRDFYIIMTFKSSDYEIFKSELKDIKDTFREQGFDVVEAKESDIKSMLQVYMERNFSSENVKDYDL